MTLNGMQCFPKQFDYTPEEYRAARQQAIPITPTARSVFYRVAQFCLHPRNL
jgi:hypothetical protein